MKPLTRFRFFLRYFGIFKVAMIGYLRPRIVTLNDKTIVVKIKLGRRSRNHLNSMYFGALAVGADIAGGLHGFYHADKCKSKISLIFKSFHANFLYRPESDVYFVCNMGDTVQSMINETIETKQRVNKPIEITAYTDYLNNPKAIANFTLGLSLRSISGR